MNASAPDPSVLLPLLLDHSTAAFAVFDRDMRYLRASRRWLSDCGLEGASVVGRSHYDLFPDLPERWKEVHRRALAGEVVRADEDRFDRRTDRPSGYGGRSARGTHPTGRSAGS